MSHIVLYIILYYACVAGIVRVTDSSSGKARAKEKNQLPTPATRNMFRYTPEGLYTHYVYIHIFVCVCMCVSRCLREFTADAWRIRIFHTFYEEEIKTSTILTATATTTARLANPLTLPP